MKNAPLLYSEITTDLHLRRDIHVYYASRNLLSTCDKCTFAPATIALMINANDVVGDIIAGAIVTGENNDINCTPGYQIKICNFV